MRRHDQTNQRMKIMPSEKLLQVGSSFTNAVSSVKGTSLSLGNSSAVGIFSSHNYWPPRLSSFICWKFIYVRPFFSSPPMHSFVNFPFNSWDERSQYGRNTWTSYFISQRSQHGKNCCVAPTEFSYLKEQCLSWEMHFRFPRFITRYSWGKGKKYCFQPRVPAKSWKCISTQKKACTFVSPFFYRKS